MLRNRFVLVAPAVLVAVLVVLLQLPASASHSASHPCDLIASTEGSDSNSGTDIESPLRNVQTLVDGLAPGQTGCLRGTEAAAPFVENVVVANKNASGGSESDRITIRGYPGEVAKLQGHLTVEDTANRISLKQLVLEGTPGGAAVRLDGDDLVLADSNVTHTGAACVRVGVMSLAQRTQILRNRIHDCSSDGVNLGQTLYTTVRANLLYDNGGTGVKLTADADASYVYRNVIDRNGQGVMFYGASATRFADSNFIDSSVITRSTAGWNVGYTQMPGAAGNFLSQVCAYSPKNPNGGLQNNQQPQGYQVWGPAPHIGDPDYRDSVNGDFSPSDPANQCFQHSGDVNAAVKQGGGANDEEASADNPKPNILFVVTDDQRAEGTMIPEAMPQTLARLVDQGVNFTNAFATTPLCCPARASIMTGQYAHNHEVTNGSWAEDLNQDTTLQAYLKQVGSGYRTGLFGKFLNGWNLDVDPLHWDKFAIFNDGYCPFVVNENGDRKRYPAIDPSTGGPPAGECATADIGHTSLAPYSTDYVRDQALDFLEQGETDDTTDSKPWFMYVTPFAPHTPFQPEADYANLSMPPFTNTPATFEDTSDKPSWVAERATTPASVFGDGTNPGRRVQQLRTLRSVDDLVGTLLDQLQEKGEQDTLIVFASDNGYLWGDHGLTEKGAPYAAGAKVPLVMRYAPFTTPGKTDTRTVANIDLTPTALRLAGVPAPLDPPVDGQSLIGPTTPRQRIHNEFYDHGPDDVDWASTRVPGDYFYIETYADDGETIDFLEYYDLEADPYETTNLYGPDGVPDTGDDLGTPEHAVVDLHDQLRRDRLCEGTDCPPGPGGSTVDTRPPRTLITAPSAGSTVCCRVMLKADASDNIGVDRVEFRIDGNLIGTDTTEPFRMIWQDTNLYAAGPHTIEAIAVDGSGERTVSGSPGSSINVNLSQTGFDVQIDDGGVPRTSCGAQTPPCNVGTINPGDKVKFTLPSPIAPGTLIPGWDGTKPATCSGDPPSLGCVTMGLKADSQVDQFDNDSGAIYSDLAAMNKILPLGDFDLGDFDYIPFDTTIPLRTWPRSAMELTNSNKTVVITLGSGTGALGDGEVGTVTWTNPACNCKVWESIDGADTGEDREF